MGRLSEPIDQRERRELCDLLVELGPDAPTLCEGWTTADLLAHLLLREHFHIWGANALADEKAKGFDGNIERLRRGPWPVPWQVPGLRTVLNGGEYFIHHEDVRRANGRGARTDRPDLDALCWRLTELTGRLLALRLRPNGVELRRPGGQARRLGREPRVVITGEPGELALYLSGRRSAAQVTLDGPPEAVARAGSVKLGF